MAFKFERLLVWQLTAEVNEVVKHFPKDELYIITSQMKRAADSVALNIAEGSTSQSNAEFCRFLNIALRSVVEVVGCIILAKQRLLIEEACFKIIYNLCSEILAMINSLKKSLIKHSGN